MGRARKLDAVSPSSQLARGSDASLGGEVREHAWETAGVQRNLRRGLLSASEGMHEPTSPTFTSPGWNDNHHCCVVRRSQSPTRRRYLTDLPLGALSRPTAGCNSVSLYHRHRHDRQQRFRESRGADPGQGLARRPPYRKGAWRDGRFAGPSDTE